MPLPSGPRPARPLPAREGAPTPSPVAKGLAHVFIRRDGAPLPPGPAGHVGWGFSDGDGAYHFGATENPAGSPIIRPGQDNGWWMQSAKTETAMLKAMAALAYDGYKVATVRDVRPHEALKAAATGKGRGYTAVTNDCLVHTQAVLEAYGVKGLPWRSLHPAPNEWFVFYIGEYRNL